MPVLIVGICPLLSNVEKHLPGDDNCNNPSYGPDDCGDDGDFVVRQAAAGRRAIGGCGSRRGLPCVSGAARGGCSSNRLLVSDRTNCSLNDGIPWPVGLPPPKVVVVLGFAFSAAAMSTPHWPQKAVKYGCTAVELHSSSYLNSRLMLYCILLRRCAHIQEPYAEIGVAEVQPP